MNETSLDLAREIAEDTRRHLPRLYEHIVQELAAGACPKALKRWIVRRTGTGVTAHAAAITIDYCMRVCREREAAAR